MFYRVFHRGEPWERSDCSTHRSRGLFKQGSKGLGGLFPHGRQDVHLRPVRGPVVLGSLEPRPFRVLLACGLQVRFHSLEPGGDSVLQKCGDSCTDLQLGFEVDCPYNNGERVK